MMQNGGKFNDIGHYHMHIFLRYDSEKFGWTCSEKQYEFTKKIADRIKANV